MNKLSIPLHDTPVAQIFDECINDYRDDEKKRTGLKYRKQLISCSERYLEHMPVGIENLKHGYIDKKGTQYLNSVYENKFVKGIGRQYYNRIMNGAHGICPFCGTGAAMTLDHYLPKKNYPLLSITPANLVPACRDCNMNKQKYNPSTYSEMILHPYFDEVDIAWLDARIIFEIDDSCNVEYGVKPLQGISTDMGQRIRAHFSVNKLEQIYHPKAITEIMTSRTCHLKVYKSCGISELKNTLYSTYESSAQYDLNSWKTALYEALSNQVEQYVEWLLAFQNAKKTLLLRGE